VREGLVDEFLVYLAPKLLGQGQGMANFGPLAALSWTRCRCNFQSIDGSAPTCASWPRVGAGPVLGLQHRNDRCKDQRPQRTGPGGSFGGIFSGPLPPSSRRAARTCENGGMFTGIITGVGRIAAIDDLGSSSDHGKRLTIEAPAGYLDDVGLGDSIALNGACMTATTLDRPPHRFTIDISAESLDKTTGLAETGPVNLEKALRAHDRLGGHIVSGHVDGIGSVRILEPVGESWELRILAPRELGKYLAYKGSITVNGVSLTVNSVPTWPKARELSINLIPHTVREHRPAA
jgi:riboflavin synthase